MSCKLAQSPSAQRILAVLSSLSYRTGNLDQYLQEVACGLCDLIGLDWSVITLCIDGQEQILASTLDLGAAKDDLYALHGTLAGTVITSGKSLIVEDTLKTTEFGIGPEGYRAYLGVPLQTRTGEVLGTICSFQREPRQFTDAEVRLANVFAERAATAIDNYQLYQQQQQFNQVLEAEIVNRTVELRAAQSQLMAINNELEQRVEQRTAELQRLNQQLQAEICERAAIEKALRESEIRFRTLVENAADAMMVINPQGQLVEVSHQACTLLGYSREELLTLSIMDIETGFSADEIAAIRRQFGVSHTVSIEGTLRCKDGRIVPVEARIRLFESNGQHLELAVVRDISERARLDAERRRVEAERHQAEEALRESEEWLRCIFDGSRDAIFIVDADARFVDVNDAAVMLTGYSHAELKTMTIPDLHDQADLGAFQLFFQRILTGEAINSEAKLRRKDGSKVDVEFSNRRIVVRDAVYMHTVARDITQRKKAEAALRQNEEQLRQIAENLHQVLWLYSETREPIYISPAFEQIWQYPCQQWYTDPDLCWKAIHPDDVARVRTAFEHAMEQGFQEEYRIIRPDGSIRVISDQAFPIRDQAGHPYRLAGIAEDITTRRQAEQDMLKAIASLAEVGELAAMIVHEVRNPLTTIVMGLNSFQRLDLPAGMHERLTLAIDEAERLRNLLNEILLYAKPHTLNYADLELNHFIGDMLERMQVSPSVLNHRLEFIPSSMPICVRGDKDKLKQVFINLIDNACEAAPDGSVVVWTIKPIPDQHRVWVQVHNCGEPIPAEEIPKLTKPFYTTKTCGTGLGMAIVKRIVEAHGGELLIESSAEQGTTVGVALAIAS